MEKLKIGITAGDINGIGLEVALKTLLDKRLRQYCIPVLYASSKAVSYHKNIVSNGQFDFLPLQSADHLSTEKINVVNCWQDTVNITLGKLTEEGGKYAYISLDAAVKDLQAGKIDALVTAPINKKAMQLADFPYQGHTEYLEKELGGKSLMLMVNDDLRVGLATNHLPLRQVAEALTKELLLEKIKVLNQTLKRDFAIDRPSIAVLGLNPHAGDGGIIGDEEESIIRPAVVECKKNGILVMGPFPADGFFGRGTYRKYDAVLAMYHDQGLLPFKILSDGAGVNYTAGLPFVRTSPEHGTAYELAGKNEADPESFRQAVFLALDIVRNRRDYEAMHANALVKRHQEAEEGDPAEFEKEAS